MLQSSDLHTKRRLIALVRHLLADVGNLGARGAHRAGMLDSAVRVTPAMPSISSPTPARRATSRFLAKVVHPQDRSAAGTGTSACGCFGRHPLSLARPPRWHAKTIIWRHPTIVLALKYHRSDVAEPFFGASPPWGEGFSGARRTQHHKSADERVSRQIGDILQARNIVLVVDDDLGVLKGVRATAQGARIRTHPVLIGGGV